MPVPPPLLPAPSFLAVVWVKFLAGGEPCCSWQARGGEARRPYCSRRGQKEMVALWAQLPAAWFQHRLRQSPPLPIYHWSHLASVKPGPGSGSRSLLQVANSWLSGSAKPYICCSGNGSSFFINYRYMWTEMILKMWKICLRESAHLFLF